MISCDICETNNQTVTKCLVFYSDFSFDVLNNKLLEHRLGQVTHLEFVDLVNGLEIEVNQKLYHISVPRGTRNKLKESNNVHSAYLR